MAIEECTLKDDAYFARELRNRLASLRAVQDEAVAAGLIVSIYADNYLTAELPYRSDERADRLKEAVRVRREF